MVSSSTASAGVRQKTPALLTKASTRPKRPQTISHTARIDSGLVTSMACVVRASLAPRA